MLKRNIYSLVVATALVIAATAAPARAQNNVQATFGNLIAALNNINVQIENLEALNDLTIGDVTVIDARNLLQGARIRALNNSLNNNNVEILNLRNVLNDNEIIKDVLNDANIVINDVIAIDVLSGEVNVFVLRP